MNKVLILIFIFLCLNAFSQEAKITNIISHNRSTVTTDPAKGIKDYPAWTVFPSKDVPYRKIRMYITLGCPDTIPCAHWDYLDHIMLVKQGGVNGKPYNFEIGRMLTPYGSIFSKGWDFTWWADVTDFSMLLRDSVLISYRHSGYEPVSVGWSLTVRFEITQGPPVIQPVAISPLWNGEFRYGDKNDDIEKKLSPIEITLNKNNFARLRIQHTGHGMDTPKGCSEFCSRWRDVLMDNSLVERKNLWKDCGNNPLYPQGGTWIFDRALWCPGDLQQPDQYDFFTAPGKHLVDLEMEPYTATDNIQANESVASYLIEFQKPKTDNDVALEEIIVPSKDKAYNRVNPAAQNPRIMVRNLGAKPLKSFKVTWFTKGFQKHEYNWKGNLDFNKTTQLSLPGMIDQSKGTNVFQVTLSNPNGKKDGWTGDNSLLSVFNSPIELPEKIIVRYLTNNKPAENDIWIVNTKGDTVYKKGHENLKPQTLYSDTLQLIKGNYELTLADTAGNGLEFWYETEQGFGYLRLLDEKERLLYNFESDCGNGQFLAFTTTPDFKNDTVNSQYSFILFPRRVKKEITLDYHSDKMVDMQVLITSDGVPVETHWYKRVKQGKISYDISHLPAGRYIMDVSMNGESKFKRRFNKE